MDNSSRSPDALREAGEDGRNLKVAACLTCRRSKVKCERSPEGDRCRRCSQLGSECVRPAFNVGRRKGVKNKRKGLEKALYQVEEALRRAATTTPLSVDAGKAILDLKALLGSGIDVSMPEHPGSRPRQRRMTMESRMTMDSELQDSSSSEDGGEGDSTTQPDGFAPIVTHRENTEERLAVDDAENPLQLLARASNLHLSPQASSEQSPGTAVSAHPPATLGEQDEEMADVQAYFAYSKFNLDVGPEVDPITLGLVSEEESETLFSFFHQNLAHTRWGLDPVLYTAPFTRSRSAFLFTSIMAASALFMPNAGALSKRLSIHAKTLAQRVLAKRHRSVEIVLAFMINVPWMFPGEHSTDDDTSWYVAMATTIAIDLMLHKVLLPYDGFGDGNSSNLARADCIDPNGTLPLGGFKDVDPTSELGRRLLRRRERTWLALFVLERGMCLARGRTYTIPITHLIRHCDRWHLSDIADKMDGHLVSMAVLRRDLDDLFEKIRSLCDGSVESLTDGSLIAQSIQGMIEKFFDQWLIEWGSAIGIGPQHRLPPYVEILVTHTRLSIYSTVVNHPTAPAEVRQFFRTAGLSSALNVMRAAIQGEAQLSSMPNNTAIMISFAACFALRLSSQVVSGNSNLAPSVRALIEETADVLERIGGVTRHRNGMSTLYGKYLRILVRKAESAVTTGTTSAAGNDLSAAAVAGINGAAATARSSVLADGLPSFHLGAAALGGFGPADPMVSQPGYMSPTAWPEPFQFSAMSDDQIVEALNRAGNEFDGGFGSMHWEDAGSLDWMNWSNLPDFGF
ncbi:Protein priB [Pleurostoma richardsiae]|uniref:Protein priB n=1 Tax=Pleurostoma richardsiae TaxID=41990 RepID=A0AA38VQZ8_9PEZI|nr:Protein priB [Pleurostoma richardsiae]